MKKPLFLLIIYLSSGIMPVVAEEAFPDEGMAPHADVKAYVDKSTVLIGDSLRFRIDVDLRPSGTVEIQYPDQDLGGFMIKAFGAEPVKHLGRDKIRRSQWYVLETYTVGSYVIPAQEIRITGKDGTTGILRSPEVFVEVKSVIDEEAGEASLRDIKPPLDIPGPITGLMALAGFLLAVAGAFFLWRYHQRRKAKALASPSPGF